MNLIFQAQSTLRWLHWQRLAERWWRRWVYALTGLALGFGVLWLLSPAVGENHAQMTQSVAALQQQLAVLPSTMRKPSEQAPASPMQPHLASLPHVTRQGQLWTDWQQVLAVHGLRLQSLQPVASGGLGIQGTAAGGTEERSALPYQATALRVRGRFEDWTRLWAACTEAGPVCSLDRIRVAATEQANEVQIDMVLRLWMQPGDSTSQRAVMDAESAIASQPHQTDWLAPFLQTFVRHSGATLFVSDAASGSMSQRPSQSLSSTAAATEGASPAMATLEVLSQDPRHWPLAAIRLVGLWQQGSERQAFLSAGGQWARVSRGQRVTLEGHRVVAITDRGVSLRLASGPVIQLDWQGSAADIKSARGEP
jgi:hypothetical protein